MDSPRTDVGADLVRLRRAARVARLTAWCWTLADDTIELVETGERLPGLPDGRYSATQILDGVHPDDRASLRAAIDAAIADRSAFSIDVRFVRSAGDVSWLEMRGECVLDDHGAPVRVEGAMLDVGERKRTEESLAARERQLHTVVNAIPALIAYFDRDVRYRFVNRSYEAWFGRALEDVLGRTMRDVIGDEPFSKVRGFVERALRGEAVQYEVELALPHIGRRWVDAQYVPHRAPDGSLAGFYALVLDVTQRKQVELALSESEKRFSEFLEQAPFSVQVVSPDGTTLHVNPAFERLWGLRFEQLAAYNMLRDAQLEQRGVLALIRRAFEGEAVSVPPIAYDPNETLPGATSHTDPVRWVGAVVYPVKDAQGRVAQVVVVHDDATARMVAESRLRESEERLRLVHQAAHVGAWEWQSATGEVYWSPEYRDIYGFAADEPPTFERGIEPVVAEDRERVLSELQSALRAGGEFRSEHRIVHPVRGPRWIAAVGKVLLADSEPAVRMMGIVLDVTDRRIAEDALKEADRRKDEFIAMLSHELRNPLAPLVNSIQLLRRATSAEQTVGVYDVMERQVEHMVRLIDDLLEASRISRGVLELRPARVELTSVIANAIETVEPFIAQRGHHLQRHVPARPTWIDGDPVRLAQIFANLLNNAARYTEPGGAITISAESNGSEAVIRVSDTGHGFAPESAARLFEMFVRGEHSHGLGIGLALARRLTEMHGGTIDASSDGDGRGAVFTVRLPVVDGNPTAEAPQAPARDAAPVCRVLVADDNRDAADSMTRLLRALGNDVVVAYDGEQAIEAARTFRPDVAFLDIGMPIVNGYDVARAIRAQAGASPIKLVAVTGWGMDADRQRGREAGFDDHLVKPAGIEALSAVLASVRR